MSTLELFQADWKDVWQGVTPEPVGSVFTRPEIVELILDLAGYRVGAGRLALRPVLEPSCGDGAFLEEILQRLLASEQADDGTIDWEDPALLFAVCAADISQESLGTARDLICARIIAAGCSVDRAAVLADAWTIHTDFLLHDWTRTFSVIVGNPPYVRLEGLPRQVLQRYRERYKTATDRADLYIPFFERSLQLLEPEGVLAFICANRFAKNQYGAALRSLIARHFHVRHYVNLEHTQPFLQNVSAYPAIIVIDCEKGLPTTAATLEDCNPSTLDDLRKQVLGQSPRGGLLSEFTSWYPDGSPWQTTSSVTQKLLAHLESTFPSLENSGPETKVGIGVATGADDVFVLPSKSAVVEASRQLPLLMAQDVRPDLLSWSGHYVINPFSDMDDGSLATLADYPGLQTYLEDAQDQLLARHVAKSRPSNWYRTIDRIWPKLQAVPKLVIPDIQAGGVVGHDTGHFYPHHNLYWVTSATWDLRALQALLRSSFTLLQVRAHSVQMRGGSLRYQAQTLRRLRLPALSTLSATCLADLSRVATETDQTVIDAVAAEAFCIPLSTLPWSLSGAI